MTVMEKNVIQKIRIKQKTFDAKELRNKLNEIQVTIPSIYSCLLYYDDNYTFLLNIDQNQSNNTIRLDTVIQELNDTIDLSKKTIYFKQPSVEVMIHTYNNYIYSLSLEQQMHWKNLELDDLLQIGYICIFNLDRKGYYVHKQLLRKTFINEVLRMLRVDKYKPTVISLDAPLKLDEGNAEVEDLIPSVDTIAEFFDNMTCEQDRIAMIDEQRRLVQLFVTPRRYDQLIREYGNKITTNAGRKKINELKNKFKAMGYDKNYWRNN